MAFFKGSYYQNLPIFDSPEDGTKPFKGVRARPVPAPESVLEHFVALGDRLDTLAQHYYAEPRDWRRLADCNSDEIFLEDALYDTESEQDIQTPRLGRTVLIPRRRDGGTR
jgi:nucleoid-associated protein YgaU